MEIYFPSTKTRAEISVFSSLNSTAFTYSTTGTLLADIFTKWIIFKDLTNIKPHRQG
jgi:hypothetical protein